MRAAHLELLVEEPSMEAFLRAHLPNLLGRATSFEVYPYQGKDDLLNRLEQRLRGYAAWLPQDWRIVVIVDRDDDDCLALKDLLEARVLSAGLRSRRATKSQWQVVTRIAVEELESWYFGDWQAVSAVYPRVPQGTAGKASFRDCDAIRGGTWECFGC